MRNRLALSLATGAVFCGAWTLALAQAPVRGIHEPSAVTIVEPAPPAAPKPPPSDVTPVIAESKHLTKAELERASLSFVQTYATPTAKLDQFARWREPICISVVGLGADKAEKLAARIKDVAKTIGVNALGGSCVSNIEIIFSDGQRQWQDWVNSNRDAILSYHYVNDLSELRTLTRPVQAWYETATRRDGGQDNGLTFAGSGRSFNAVSARDETIDGIPGPSAAGCGNSRFTSCLQSVFKNVLVYVDGQRMKEGDLGPLADYLAMLTLSQPRTLDGCANFASVMDILTTRCTDRVGANSLTWADQAYLKALYTADLEARRGSEETDIAARMAKYLIKAAGN
jgi:hypothetical protein